MGHPRKRRIYISGPISSEVPNVDREARKARFHTAEKWLLQNTNYEVANPLKVPACVGPEDIKCGLSLESSEETHTWDCNLRYDLIELLSCNAILLLPHWELSRGAILEHHVASTLGLDIIDWTQTRMVF